MIEHRPDRASPYRVRRLGGRLTASFVNENAAKLQDELWKLWRDQVPVLADKEPNAPPALQAQLLQKNGSRKLDPSLLAKLLAVHPAREAAPAAAVASTADPGVELFGDYLEKFFPRWADGTAVTVQEGQKTEQVMRQMEEWLNKHVYEIVWERDPDTGHRVRDKEGNRIAHGWGANALAWVPLVDLRPRHFVALLERLESEGVGREVQRKLRGCLDQALRQAALEEHYPQDLANPAAAVPAPKQVRKIVRKPYLPEIVELMRADFLSLDPLSEQGLRRTKLTKIDTPAGVPIPEVAGFGQFSADLIEIIAYASTRPGEALGAFAAHYAPEEFEEDAWRYLKVCQRDRDGEIYAGTKSKPFPEKLVYLLGPLPETMQRLCEGRSPNDLILPYPPTGKAMTADEYKNWRVRYFAPIARSHGLGPDADDPYALRHVYATLRLAAHHSIFEINQSMGTSLAGTTYGEIQARYQGKGPIDIDAVIAKARKAAGL